jgi:hypothetical protein
MEISGLQALAIVGSYKLKKNAYLLIVIKMCILKYKIYSASCVGNFQEMWLESIKSKCSPTLLSSKDKPLPNSYLVPRRSHNHSNGSHPGIHSYTIYGSIYRLLATCLPFRPEVSSTMSRLNPTACIDPVMGNSTHSILVHLHYPFTYSLIKTCIPYLHK